MTAQAILFLDSQGQVHCELPGRNGSRQKIDLPSDFAERNPELVTILQAEAAEQDRIARRRQEYTNLLAQRQAELDAQRKQETNEEIWRKREAKWNEEYRNATPERRAEMDEKKAKATLAHQLWLDSNKKHGIGIANKVIPDKKRRPNKRFAMSDGTTYNPRTGNKFDKNGKRIKQPGDRFKGIDTSRGELLDIKF